MVERIVLRAEHATRRLEGDVPVTLVNGVDIDIRAGEFTVITGPSGSGKSSVLYLLGLLDRPTSGRILLHGEDTSMLNDDQMADHRLSQIGFVFQFHFLLPEFTAIENVILPMRRLERLSPREMRERAATMLEALGLGQHFDKLPKQLSGGQSQRVAIARALANEPGIVLADEPTGNLDTASSVTVQGILRDLAHSQNRAVVVVTHDNTIAESADRRISIVDGKVAN